MVQIVLKRQGEGARVVDLEEDASLGRLFAREGIDRESVRVRIDGAIRRAEALLSTPLRDGVEVQIEDREATVEKMLSVHIGALGRLQTVNVNPGATYRDALAAGGIQYGRGIQVRSGGREIKDLDERLQEEGQQPILILGKVRGGA